MNFKENLTALIAFCYLVVILKKLDNDTRVEFEVFDGNYSHDIRGVLRVRVHGSAVRQKQHCLRVHHFDPVEILHFHTGAPAIVELVKVQLQQAVHLLVGFSFVQNDDFEEIANVAVTVIELLEKDGDG